MQDTPEMSVRVRRLGKRKQGGNRKRYVEASSKSRLRYYSTFFTHLLSFDEAFQFTGMIFFVKENLLKQQSRCLVILILCKNDVFFVLLDGSSLFVQSLLDLLLHRSAVLKWSHARCRDAAQVDYAFSEALIVFHFAHGVRLEDCDGCGTGRPFSHHVVHHVLNDCLQLIHAILIQRLDEDVFRHCSLFQRSE